MRLHIFRSEGEVRDSLPVLLQRKRENSWDGDQKGEEKSPEGIVSGTVVWLCGV